MNNSLFHLGEFQKLQVVKEVPMGVYLSVPETLRSADEGRELILLPKGDVPEGICKDDLINVFIYKDSEDRYIATTLTPGVSIGKFAMLEVSQVTGIGAFLSWGLMKDLFLPFKEQTYRVKKGDRILVTLYIDKSNRLCATMHLYNYLLNENEYKKDNEVSGTVYELSDNFGAFVAVDNMYSALIPRTELVRNLYIGESVKARVKEVKPDGRLTLSLRSQTHTQMDKDCVVIMEHLNAHGGFLPFHDKSTPESIRREFSMSKAEFKRAIGRLYKNGSIVISDDGIRIKASSN